MFTLRLAGVVRESAISCVLTNLTVGGWIAPDDYDSTIEINVHAAQPPFRLFQTNANEISITVTRCFRGLKLFD